MIFKVSSHNNPPGSGVPWITLSLGDLAVKLFVSLVMLIPFRILLKISKPI